MNNNKYECRKPHTFKLRICEFHESNSFDDRGVCGDEDDNVVLIFRFTGLTWYEVAS